MIHLVTIVENAARRIRPQVTIRQLGKQATTQLVQAHIPPTPYDLPVGSGSRILPEACLGIS